MPSKRTFAKRLGALVAAGLGASGPIDTLTAEPPPAGTLAVDAAGEPRPAADGSSGHGTATREPRSAVGNGTYKPAAVTSRAADTVVTARLDPSLVTVTGLPGGVAAPIRDVLSRHDSVSLDRLQQVAGGAALTPDGPEGCGVAVGDIDARTLRSELAGDPDVVREPAAEAGFARFKAERADAALGVRANELVVAHGPSTSSAVAHRDAGIDGGNTGQPRRKADYGPLPSLLRGDATVCVDLGVDAREALRRTLTDAPEALRTAVDASAAVGVACSVATDGSTGESPSATPATRRRDTVDAPPMALRYGAVADPKRLDRETVEAVARAARDGDPSFSEATITRHGRTVTLDATADGDPFAPHAALAGVNVGDPEPLSDS